MSQSTGIEFADSRCARPRKGELILNIPSGLREKLDIEAGDELFWILEDGELRVRPPSY
jgi:AbrB family looped-hinge helix DNA binding protein